MSDNGGLARAAAQIAELKTQVDVGRMALATANAEVTRCHDQLAALTPQITEIAQLRARTSAAENVAISLQHQLDGLAARVAENAALTARVAELQHLLSPADSSSGVLKVSYSDGRVKYAASDGSKYLIPADAVRRTKVLALMKTGMLEAQAEIAVAYADNVIKALS